MTSNLDMFDIPLPPDPGGEHSLHFLQDTSLRAYRRWRDGWALESQRAVLGHIQRCGWHGSTNDEGWRVLRCDTPNGYAPVVTGLKKLGIVVWRGIYRDTVAGNPAKVWVTTLTWIEHHLANGAGP